MPSVIIKQQSKLIHLMHWLTTMQLMFISDRDSSNRSVGYGCDDLKVGPMVNFKDLTADTELVAKDFQGSFFTKEFTGLGRLVILSCRHGNWQKLEERPGNFSRVKSLSGNATFSSFQ